MRLIKGRNSVLEALRAGVELDRISLLYEHQNKADFKEIITLSKRNRIKLQLVSKSYFDKPNNDHAQGVIAYGVSENLTDLTTLLKSTDEFPLVVMLDHIEDPHNMGAIIRSAETLGASAIIYAKDRQSQLTPTVTQTSAGAVHFLTMVRVTNLAQSLEKLKKAGYWIYGSDDAATSSLDTFKPNFPAVIIVSNEGKGISSLLHKKVDDLIKIPLRGKVSSLNVSVAAGILLNEFRKYLP